MTSDPAQQRSHPAAHEAAAPPRRSLPPIMHGTTSGYAAHRRRGIPMCTACRAADRMIDDAQGADS